MCEEDWEREAYQTKIYRGNPAILPGDADTVVMFDPEGENGNINITGQQAIREIIQMKKIKKRN